MAQVSINIPVENIAGMINNMDVKEIETLCLLLNLNSCAKTEEIPINSRKY